MLWNKLVSGLKCLGLAGVAPLMDLAPWVQQLWQAVCRSQTLANDRLWAQLEKLWNEIIVLCPLGLGWKVSLRAASGSYFMHRDLLVLVKIVMSLRKKEGDNLEANTEIILPYSKCIMRTVAFIGLNKFRSLKICRFWTVNCITGDWPPMLFLHHFLFLDILSLLLRLSFLFICSFPFTPLPLIFPALALEVSLLLMDS